MFEVPNISEKLKHAKWFKEHKRTQPFKSIERTSRLAVIFNAHTHIHTHTHTHTPQSLTIFAKSSILDVWQDCDQHGNNLTQIKNPPQSIIRMQLILDRLNLNKQVGGIKTSRAENFQNDAYSRLESIRTLSKTTYLKMTI